MDVVHTNIGFKGKMAPLGHLDFYANNGIAQPGCGTSNYTFLSDIGSVHNKHHNNWVVCTRNRGVLILIAASYYVFVVAIF